MKSLVSTLKTFWSDEKGLEVVEYVVIGALVVLVTIAGYTQLGGNANNKVTQLSTSF